MTILDFALWEEFEISLWLLVLFKNKNWQELRAKKRFRKQRNDKKNEKKKNNICDGNWIEMLPSGILMKFSYQYSFVPRVSF